MEYRKTWNYLSVSMTRRVVIVNVCMYVCMRCTIDERNAQGIIIQKHEPFVIYDWPHPIQRARTL